MKLELLVYTSVFALMVGVSGSLLGMEPNEDAPTLQKAAAAASSDPLSTEDWRAPFFQKKYCLSGPSLNLEALKKEIITISLNHMKLAENQEHPSKIDRIKSLLNDASDKEDETLHEFLYRVYSGAIMKTSPFNDPQKAAEILERAYEQEEMWSFWAKASLAPKGELTRAHYLAANRGHKEAAAYVKTNTPYKLKIAKDFCNQLKKTNQKFQHTMITDFEKKWQEIGYAQPFLDVLNHMKTPILDRTRFLKIAADLGDLNSQCRLVQNGIFFPYLEKAAKQGNVGAMYNLGVLSREQNKLEEAEIWFRKAAEGGLMEPMNSLGTLIRNSNPAEAEIWFRKAAIRGDVKGVYNLGVLLYEQNKLEEAKTWFRKSAEHGNILAMNNLGALRIRNSNPAKAEIWFRKAAEGGLMDAMTSLGALIKNSNPTEAEIWYRKAADLGQVGAMRNLGTMLYKQNKLEETEIWLRKAAEHGNRNAMNDLGAFLKEQNKLEEAEKWYREAVKHGCVEAMHNLGVLLQDQNKLEEAEIWYRKEAVKHGYVETLHNLGVLLQDQNKLEEAEIWYRKAALKEFAPSMVQLGKLHLDCGDSAEATFWFEKAAALGNQNAQELLEVSQKSVQPLALRNDEVLPLSPEAPATMNVPEDLEIDSELDAIFKKIENPKLQTISSVQMPEQRDHLSEAPESDATSSSSEEELDENPLPTPEITVVPDIAPDVQPQVINNPKSRREKARLLGLELRHIAEEVQKPNRQLTKGPQGIANAILSEESDHITQADLKALFKDPYFAGQVIVESTKSGFTVLSHHREKKLHRNAGAHHKHGQEKYTGHIHPNTLKGVKKILNIFDVEKK